MRVIERFANLNEMCRVENLSGVAFTGEEGGHEFIITAIKNDAVTPFVGSVSGQVRCPDGTSVQLTTGYCEINEYGRAVVKLAGNCYEHGSGPFGLIVYHTDGDGNRVVIYAAAGFMQTGEAASPVDPEHVINVSAIQAIISDMQEAIADCEDAAAFVPNLIAAEYNYLSTYGVGDYCTHEGYLYRCVVPITTAGSAWGVVSGNFQKVDVAGEMFGLTNAFNEMYAADVTNTNTWTVGSLKAADGTALSSTTRLRMNNFVNVEDEVFRVKARDGYEFLVYAWNKTSGNYIGCLKTGGVFDTTSSNYLWLKEYNIANQPGLKYKVVLRNAVDTSATMTVAEAVNCLYTTRYVNDDAIAPEFDPTATYAAGDYALYETEMYRFDEAHTGAWTGTDVTKVSAGAEIAALAKSKMNATPVTLKSTDDLDAIITPGFYRWTNNSRPANSPSSYGCSMIVNGYGSYGNNSQIAVTRQGVMFVRAYNSSAWSDWYTVAYKSSVDAVSAAVETVAASVTGLEADIGTINGNVTALQAKTEDLLIDTNEYTFVTGKGIRPGTGAEASSSVYDSTDFIDVSGSVRIVFTRPMTSTASPTFGAAFYDDGNEYVEGSGIFVRGNASHAGYELYECEVPAGAKYARFSVWSAASVQTYGITDTFKLYDAEYYHGTVQGQIATMLKAEADGLGLHTVPPSEGVLNVIKRARQFTEIEWTPAVDMPRAMSVTMTPPDLGPYDIYEGVFKAGVKYKGLPYGNCEGYKPAYGYKNTYIGYNVDFGTFITSVTNGDSMLCQESHHSTNPRRSFVYAAVCSSLVCYALNTAYKLTGNIPGISGMETLCKVIDNGVRMDIDHILRQGDVLNKEDYHVSIVTDIIRRWNGTIEYIEISEATTTGNGNQAVIDGPYGGICRRFALTAEDFFWRYAEYDLLRYSKIDNVPYTKSKWVAVGNEIPMNPPDSLPCIPYEGDGFVYLAGHIPYTKILIACHDYGYLRVFKDGAEMANSPFAVGENDDYINVGFSDIGEYSAYLCNMTGNAVTAMTARCHWSVVDE